MNGAKGLAILGCTGSVGTNVLRVVEAFPGRFEVVALSCGANVERLAEQIARHRPKRVSVATAFARDALGRLVDTSGVEVGVGEEGTVAVATQPEVQLVVASAVGAVGLVPTYRALEAGKDIALANKETLVMAGELMVAQARARGGRLLPIDSEHCALHQCLDGRRPEEVRRLVLTASGGPFRTRPRESFERVTPSEALNHPTWSMGRKITIDSATLMNKGLEVIEARWLFGLPAERVDVLVHPQSVVHSMVEFVDGTVLAQLGVTDMRLPIQYALSYPERWPAAIPGMDFTRGMRLDFEAPDHERFPCLRLAYGALERGGSLPAVLNAANEEAVAAFLEERIPFTAIADSIAEVMDAHRASALTCLEDVLAADASARELSRAALRGRAGRAAGAPSPRPADGPRGL
jgi:1-deoxy-D-xylulose-5-phosphate reductoisomerase